MPGNDPEQILLESASEVLETMFFTTLVGDAAEVPSEAILSARLAFRGRPSGRFGLSVGTGTARKIAGNFLGIEEESLSEGQIGEVVCELANMLCGSVVSRLAKGSHFELLQPELQTQEAAPPAESSRISRVVELEEGTVGMWLELEQAA